MTNDGIGPSETARASSDEWTSRFRWMDCSIDAKMFLSSHGWGRSCVDLEFLRRALTMKTMSNTDARVGCMRSEVVV